ncbi:carbohydrate-binding family 9-like protein : Uncharacterized protein OS=Fimbriimonas ginsengisoli Gsoil 348 GN=OP10G_1587 PE=4 SV=1: DUF1083 [Gemmata massiliana]|uniref:Carbohydrate-binding domain-containing protein n=1 Tax=Gemmata massiliana TaxID=1210884 RepID=A0A6P2D0T2_9BACT|nr:carbohydrate-binding family 9-like protein [Gemmata massiliana]VTR94861.1 carbohydrate-binding family 9-like protein : Uncharacterized protein OS=Fimbriimonas ginsengisoli Gsoil 348 GN=OP10G_1587 PE=4 SV=1: DUF1083 [Gemmata massiliana]
MLRSLAAFIAVGSVIALALVPHATGAAPAEPDVLSPFPHPKGYVCYRAATPVVIDGDLKDAVWDAVPWSDPFADIEGDKRPKPRFRTRVKMLWDDEALYIAAELEEPDVWATLKEHDSVIFADNDFEVFLDPDGDNHLYGELELNALNTTWDLLLTKPYKDGGNAINAWEITGLQTAVKVNGTLNDPRDKDTGWTVEIKWPWKGLKEFSGRPMPPKDGDQWRINFSRVEWDTELVGGKTQKIKGKPEHNWVWSPQGLIDMHRPERWGYLQFSTAKPGEAKFKPDADWDIRDALHRCYYAQRAYHKKNGKYTSAIADLGLKDFPNNVQAQTTRTGFEVSWMGRDGTPPKPLYTITHDARIRKE